MARDDYGAISVISDEEREALGLGGRRPDDEEEGVFETLGKTADKIGETKLGQKIGSIITVFILAMFGSGNVDTGLLDDWFGEEEDNLPKGGCMDPTAINYKPDATFDNGSCTFPPPVKYGCTDASATNYDSQATHDNGRCQYLNQNGTGNETQTNETVYGCMDIDANNYNDKATEDDGSCEYEHEENHCNHTIMYAWEGLSHGNVSRPSNYSTDFYMDFDTNCDDDEDPLPILVYYDLVHVLLDANDTDGDGNQVYYDNYVYTKVFFNISGWNEDYHWFKYDELFETPFEENFNNIYEGYWIYYIQFYADYNGDGNYHGYEDSEGNFTDEWVGYSSNWAEGDLVDWAWVLEREEE